VLYGRTYTYGDLLQLTRAERLAALRARNPRVTIPADLVGSLEQRGGAANRLRRMALTEGIRRELPDCDISVSIPERVAFLRWWRRGAEAIEAAGTLTDAQQQIAKPAHDIIETNADAVQLTDQKIAEWKENACLYRAYGGRVQKPYANSLPNFSQPVIVLNGFPFPLAPPVPFDAHARHYARLIATGNLGFPEARYRALFLGFDCRLCVYYSDSEAAALLSVPYWLN
jgi:hypothetical protein